jgi:hypothetical protein
MMGRVIWQKLTDVSEVLTASIIRAIGVGLLEVGSTFEMSIGFYETTRRNIPDPRRRASSYMSP